MNDCFVFADVNWAAKAYNKVAKWPKLFHVIGYSWIITYWKEKFMVYKEVAKKKKKEVAKGPRRMSMI